MGSVGGKREPMSEMLPLGQRYENMPVPMVPGDTTFIPFGSLVIGVEYRRLTDEILDAAIPEDVREAGGISDARPSGGLDDQGVSVHVCSANDRSEYLRFDSFAEPHYHYITPGSHNVVIRFDEAADGDFLEWTFDRISRRLPEMLRHAGADALAADVDAGAVEAVVPVVQQEVKRALRTNARAGASA
jgi:hypothetical protein